MPTVNLTSYAPKDLTMVFGKWTITSPLPDAERGKKIMQIVLAANIGVNAITSGDLDQLDERVQVEGIETEDDINRLVLGSGQVDRLLADGCPPATINLAGGYALMKWGFGDEAAMTYIQKISAPEEGDAGPKAPRPASKKKKRRRH